MLNYGRPTGRIEEPGVYGIWPSIQAKRLSNRLVIWSLKHGTPSGQSHTVREMPFLKFLIM